MKFRFYVYQKEYDEKWVSWGRSTYYTTPFSTFYSFFNQEYFHKYFINDETVTTNPCYDDIAIHNNKSARLITLKIPFKERKSFKSKWTEFKSGRVSKYFYIKEK